VTLTVRKCRAVVIRACGRKGQIHRIYALPSPTRNVPGQRLRPLPPLRGDPSPSQWPRSTDRPPPATPLVTGGAGFCGMAAPFAGACPPHTD